MHINKTSHFLKQLNFDCKAILSSIVYIAYVLTAVLFFLLNYIDRILPVDTSILIENGDNVLGAYARSFCDTFGMFLAFFPVFVVYLYFLRDKYGVAASFPDKDGISPKSFIGTRCAALSVMLFVPVLVLDIISTVILYVQLPSGTAANPFAFICYSFTWLLPTLLLTVAVGACATLITKWPLAVIAQFFLWAFTTASAEVGDYGFVIALRHNSIGDYAAYHDNLGALAVNRLVCILAAVIIFTAAANIYSYKCNNPAGQKQ